MSATHYDLLGIAPDATPDEIREARRRLLATAHPDRATDLLDRERRETLSASITLAAATLLDPRTRRVYDRRIGVAPRFVASIPPEARRAVRGAAAPLLHTRAGQWALLIGATLLLGALGTDVIVVGIIVAGIAVLLARPGDPTPLGDMERMVGTVVRIARGPGADLGRRAVDAASTSLRERAAEAGLGGDSKPGMTRRPPVSGPGGRGGRTPSDGGAD